MGVPRLAPYISNNFPNCVSVVPSGTKTTRVDYLYIDANGLLHSAAQTIFNYGQRKRHMDPNTSLTHDEKILKTYDLFFSMITTVAIMIEPKKILFIAIDGSAPVAKQTQQRQRRFVAAKNRDPESTFDSNCMTPGTVFMSDLTRFMNFQIRNHLNTGRSYSIIFSPPSVPGEGEHKALEHMRSLTSEERLTKSFCMFGPDGDLIMLTLATHIPQMYLFKEDIYNVGMYNFLDMGSISEKLYTKLIPQKSKSIISQRCAIDDFILIGFFVGNDFLPKIEMFYVLEDGFEKMLSIYTTLVSTDTGFRGLTGNNTIDFTTFGRFVRKMANNEASYLSKNSTVIVKDVRFANKTLLSNIRPDGTLDFDSYRRDYYAKSHISAPEEIRVMCLDYIRSIVWVFLYYTYKLVAWEHLYKWHYAPFMTDLASTLETLSEGDIYYVTSFDTGVPSVPFVQLLSVLPPSSSNLLPDVISNLMTDPESGLVKSGIYPKDFSIDYEGKTKEHMAVCLLPHADICKVRRVYEPYKKYVRNHIRNIRGEISQLSYDPKFHARYVSKYGTIPDLHVKSQNI